MSPELIEKKYFPIDDEQFLLNKELQQEELILDERMVKMNNLGGSPVESPISSPPQQYV